MTNFWGPVVAALVGGALFYLRRIHKMLSLYDEFPPHRHINGKILYPKEFPPTKLERMES